MLEAMKMTAALLFVSGLIAGPIGYKYIRVGVGSFGFDGYFQFVDNFRNYKEIFRDEPTAMLVYYVTLLSYIFMPTGLILFAVIMKIEKAVK